MTCVYKKILALLLLRKNKRDMNLRGNKLSVSDGALASRSNFLLTSLCSTRFINNISACNEEYSQFVM
jgi:hypothetical protein